MSEEDDFDQGFQQIRHEYDMLLKEKHKIESYFEEVSSEVESKDLEIALLRKRNAQYAAVLRHFQRVERDYKAMIEQLMADLESNKRPGRMAGFNVLPDNLAYIDKDIREAVERNVASTDFDDALQQMDAACKEREKEIQELRQQRARCERDIKTLKENLAEAADVITRLRNMCERPAAQAEETNERSVEEEMQREQHVVLETPQEVLEEMALMQASLHDAHVRQRELQDLVDELQTSLSAAEEELKKLKARKPRKEQARDSGDEEDEPLELGDDRSVVRGLKGLTRAEQEKLFKDKFELQMQIDELKDMVIEEKARSAKLDHQWKKAINFSKARDKFLEQEMSKKKTLNNKEIQKILDLLRTTSLDFEEVK
eukprot:m.214810 g.214810  ORF g.214810 m.214810 type:complete len:372 (+) comp37395_c0_seq1:252-1367(+)